MANTICIVRMVFWNCEHLQIYGSWFHSMEFLYERKNIFLLPCQRQVEYNNMFDVPDVLFITIISFCFLTSCQNFHSAACNGFGIKIFPRSLPEIIQFFLFFARCPCTNRHLSSCGHTRCHQVSIRSLSRSAVDTAQCSEIWKQKVVWVWVNSPKHENKILVCFWWYSKTWLKKKNVHTVKRFAWDRNTGSSQQRSWKC